MADHTLNGPPEPSTQDAFLGGRLIVAQPAHAYRAGLDAVLLAAAARVVAGQRQTVLDAGAGVGVVGLCIAARVADAQVTLVEKQPELAALARHNVSRNRLDERVRVVEADICAAPGRQSAHGPAPDSFDHVLANPPYQEAGRGRAPPDPLKATANEMPEDGLEAWARYLARMAAPGGTVTLIHRADALARVLAVLDGRFGALEVLPVAPRAGEPAHRILVFGRKGSRAPLSLLPPLVLHGDGNRFLPAIEAVLRDGAALPIGQ